jgi:hypothetical protein
VTLRENRFVCDAFVIDKDRKVALKAECDDRPWNPPPHESDVFRIQSRVKDNDIRTWLTLAQSGSPEVNYAGKLCREFVFIKESGASFPYGGAALLPSGEKSAQLEGWRLRDPEEPESACR